MTIRIYSDGSSTGYKQCVRVLIEGEPTYVGPGGYGWVIIQDGKVKAAGYGGLPKTTVSVMELTAILEGLKALKRLGIYKPRESVTVISDSQYALRSAAGRCSPNKYKDLIKELQGLMAEFRAEDRWVRGHQWDGKGPWRHLPEEVLMNHRCDQLAGLGKADQRVSISSSHENQPLGKVAAEDLPPL